ncbi:MAG: hypothetical protein P4L35_18160 [Ignavibacteriaceae bacterium]|nr:hypothetical protein [Ignavibacteriaceae bacterium]
MKKHFLIILLLILLPASLMAFNPQEEKAEGVFLAIGVGPRLPVGVFASSSDLGYGINLELSYTNTDYLPLFLFAKVGYETYPGSQSFYQKTDYSNFSTNTLPINLGLRYYFSPLLENIVLIIPMTEVSVCYTYYQTLNQFKPSSLKSNFTDNNSKVGFSFGAGFSMFIMEILASYNFNNANQFVALDLKVRLPLYINL